MPDAAEIAERAAALRERLDAAARRAGRDPDRVRIVAVTKSWPVQVCRAAHEAGLHLLGENRVQEALPKIEALPEAEWHLVGHLQSNKARPAVAEFAWIHSVDSVALLRRIEGIAHDEDRRPVVLLQINVTGEPQKAGFAPPALDEEELAGTIAGLRYARPMGLMTMAREGSDPHPAFARLRELRDVLERRSGMPLPELSMGMSGDAEAAVEEGATLVRIGTALFGHRPGHG